MKILFGSNGRQFCNEPDAPSRWLFVHAASQPEDRDQPRQHHPAREQRGVHDHLRQPKLRTCTVHLRDYQTTKTLATNHQKEVRKKSNRNKSTRNGFCLTFFFSSYQKTTP